MSNPQRAQTYHSVPRSYIRRRQWGSRLAYISRVLPRAIADVLAASQQFPGRRVLDFGCADQPYRSLLSQADQYIGADLPGNELADITISRDGSLPSPDSDIDLVLSTQVLEHVDSPVKYLNEVRRVLRPGGELLLSTHGLMLYHRDPVDYWRWTGEGLSKTVRDAGFDVVRLDGVMGLAPTGLQLFQDATWPHLPRLLKAPYAVVMQSLVALFDRMHSPESRRQNALVYILLARKPE